MAGSQGDDDRDVDAAISKMHAPEFSTRIDDDGMVYVDLAPGEPIYRISCGDYDPVLDKRDAGGSWVVLQDDRPPSSHNPGYYLDGEYVSPHADLGCDVSGCYDGFPIVGWRAGKPIEYVKTGTKTPPPDAKVDNGGPVAIADPADMIETRPVHGELRVRFKYASDAQCEEPTEITLPLDVP